mmetsp:Transcript_32673/g.63127  ORF Transcript_32673/g.63127 Transcript_32673/m.63127 type:complete len:167 (+) Transcript_32673:132-632(+)
MWALRPLQRYGGGAMRAAMLPHAALPQANARWFAREREDINAVRKGNILLHNNQYIEVKHWEINQKGRSAISFTVKYEELDTGKNTEARFGPGVKLTKVTPEKMECQVMYLKGGDGKEEKMVVLADDEYNEVEIPISRFYSKPDIAEGMTVVLHKEEEELVKITVK